MVFSESKNIFFRTVLTAKTTYTVGRMLEEVSAHHLDYSLSKKGILKLI